MSNPKVIIGKSLLKKMKTFPFSVKKMDIETKAMIRCLKCPGGPWSVLYPVYFLHLKLIDNKDLIASGILVSC
jgi:hypothetical protein